MHKYFLEAGAQRSNEHAIAITKMPRCPPLRTSRPRRRGDVADSSRKAGLIVQPRHVVQYLDTEVLDKTNAPGLLGSSSMSGAQVSVALAFNT